MQKSSMFARRLSVFLPRALVFFFYENFAGRIVGRLNPLAALSAEKNTDSFRGQTGYQSPFEGFGLKDKEAARPARDTVARQEPLNPNYDVKEEFFGSRESNIVIRKENCYVKNVTNIDNETVKGYMLSPVAFKAEKNSSQPQILIMHTHATESYLPYYTEAFDPSYAFRSTDKEKNMTAVGRTMRE